MCWALIRINVIVACYVYIISLPTRQNNFVQMLHVIDTIHYVTGYVVYNIYVHVYPEENTVLQIITILWSRSVLIDSVANYNTSDVSTIYTNNYGV